MKSILFGFIGGVVGAYAFGIVDSKIEAQKARKFVLKVVEDDGTGTLTTKYLKPDLTLSLDVADAQIFNGLEIKQAINNPLFVSYEVEEIQSAALAAVSGYHYK